MARATTALLVLLALLAVAAVEGRRVSKRDMRASEATKSRLSRIVCVEARTRTVDCELTCRAGAGSALTNTPRWRTASGSSLRRTALPVGGALRRSVERLTALSDAETDAESAEDAQAEKWVRLGAWLSTSARRGANVLTGRS
jgi:hypothetical protein